MVKRTSLEGDDCPVARSLDAIGDWWSLLIIRDALFGARRFGEFHRPDIVRARGEKEKPGRHGQLHVRRSTAGRARRRIPGPTNKDYVS